MMDKRENTTVNLSIARDDISLFNVLYYKRYGWGVSVHKKVQMRKSPQKQTVQAHCQYAIQAQLFI